MAEQGSAPTPAGEYFRVCSICRKPIEFGARYYKCSVSTCNRSRTALFFCSVPCWDAHVPEARHRDAWAEEVRAPTREAFEAEQREAAEAERARMENKPERERKIVTVKSDEVPKDILVVVSKLKAYVKARSGMNTSDAVAEVLSDHLRRLCDLAIDNASADGRKTVLDRDVKPLKILP
jgi:histone H3/H4